VKAPPVVVGLGLGTKGEGLETIVVTGFQVITARGNSATVKVTLVEPENAVAVGDDVATTRQVPSVVKEILPELLLTTQLLVELALSTEYPTAPPLVTGVGLGVKGEPFCTRGVGAHEMLPVEHDALMAVKGDASEPSVMVHPLVSTR
jgi:hypothetical protein